jgi:citrate lyase subunit beta / citryl-CoA lyase
MRSMLFVPGDSARKLAKAADSAADALIVDLEDAVAPEQKPAARQATREFLSTERRQSVYVRINALDEIHACDDLAAIVAGAPDGVMLPKCRTPNEVRILDHMLTALEVREGLPRGRIGILPIAVELASTVFHLGGYRDISPRLRGLMWGVEDLAVDLTSEVRGLNGAYLPAIELGRSMCLYAAAAAGVPAVDAVYTDFRNLDGLAADADAARRAGFSCKTAIHPQQIEIINLAFTPDAAALANAARIVEAFRVAAGQGAIALDGRMYDRPHLRAAELVLARAVPR